MGTTSDIVWIKLRYVAGYTAKDMFALLEFDDGRALSKQSMAHAT